MRGSEQINGAIRQTYVPVDAGGWLPHFGAARLRCSNQRIDHFDRELLSNHPRQAAATAFFECKPDGSTSIKHFNHDCRPSWFKYHYVFNLSRSRRPYCLSSIILSPLNGNVKMSPISIDTRIITLGIASPQVSRKSRSVRQNSSKLERIYELSRAFVGRSASRREYFDSAHKSTTGIAQGKEAGCTNPSRISSKAQARGIV